MSLIGEIRADLPLLVVALPEEAEHFDTELPILYTGVGKVAAAVAVTRVLATTRPAGIINLGTAGALRPGLTGTHEIGEIIQHDFDSASIKALTGKRFGAPISLGCSGLTLATGDIFVSDPDLRVELASHAHLVDMEGYAVAAAAFDYGVPVRMVKHVSDEAGTEAFVSWTSTISECSRALASWLAVS